MKKLIPNVITPEEASYLASLKPSKNPTVNHLVHEKIRSKIGSLVDANWDPPAYTRLERRNGNAHNWHKDTGSRKHMTWCTYGCSVLLRDDEGAGYLEYRDGLKIPASEHYCGLAIHSSDEEHRTVHGGKRQTYLAFLA